jgi:hypothetical protein
MALKDALGKFGDHFKAVDFEIKGNMKVKTLRKKFKDSFKCTLRVYYGVKFANENFTLAKIRKGGSGNNFSFKASCKVGEFEKKFNDVFGIKVQVAFLNDNELADNNLTLGQIARLSQK